MQRRHNHRLARLTDRGLIASFREVLCRDGDITVEVLEHVTEIQRRKLFLPLGFPSMYKYCVQEFGMSEDVAYKRIKVARVAAMFPWVLDAIVDRRLHLTGIVMLKPHLNRENGAELLTAIEYKTAAEIRLLLAQRFPKPDTPAVLRPVRAVAVASMANELAARPVPAVPKQLATKPIEPPATAGVLSEQLAARPVEFTFRLEATLSQRAHDNLRRAQELLSHQIPSGDLAQVLDRVLSLAVGELEKSKFAATDRPRKAQASSKNSRRIPAHVKRAVRARDGDQCTFVSESGHRCDGRKHLEFDHVHEYARGGQSTVANLRLRCRAHNQYTAERTYGEAFMQNKRGRLLA